MNRTVRLLAGLILTLTVTVSICVSVTAPAASAATRTTSARALGWAEAQHGKPYAWGGTGPRAFDCSGLARAAYGHGTGIWLPHNTVAMLRSGLLQRVSRPRPGDLVLWGGGSPYHVELWLRPGWSWGAQHGGTVVGAHQLWGSYAFYRVG